MPTYTYDRATGQYRGSNGRFVSAAQIAQLVGDTQDNLRRTIGRLTTKLTTNQISIAQWQSRVLAELKTTHHQLALLGSGGGAVDEMVQRQAEKNAQQLSEFGQSISNGKYSIAQIDNYAGNYANATKETFYTAQIDARVQSGIKTAKRVLDGQATHCDDCRRYAGLGYVSLEDLVIPTNDCACGYGCRCGVVYRWY
jgi:hypothetical protein